MTSSFRQLRSRLGQGVLTVGMLLGAVALTLMGTAVNAASSALAEQAKLTASDAAASDEFGVAVAVDGDTAVVGAFGDDDRGASSGAAYVFTRIGSTWTEQAKLTATDAAASDEFGVSVAVDSDTAVIGTNRGDGNIANSGAAYVFTRTGTTWTPQAKLTASDGALNDFFGSSVALSTEGLIRQNHVTWLLNRKSPFATGSDCGSGRSARDSSDCGSWTSGRAPQLGA